MSSRAPLTFRHWTRSCILCMGSTRGKEWILAVGVGEINGGIDRGKHIHCWMLSRSKTGGVISVFTLIHANAGMRMRFVSLKQTLTEMLSVSCLDTPSHPTILGCDHYANIHRGLIWYLWIKQASYESSRFWNSIGRGLNLNSDMWRVFFLFFCLFSPTLLYMDGRTSGTIVSVIFKHLLLLAAELRS